MTETSAVEVHIDSQPKSADAPAPTSTSTATTGDNKSAGSAGAAADKANAALANNKHAQAASGALSPGFNEPFFGCFSNIQGCALSCCCPCVVAAANEANVTERPVTWVDFICCSTPYATKQAMRKKYGMGYAPWNDCFAEACCRCCSLHQTAREIGNRSGKAPEYMKMP